MPINRLNKTRSSYNKEDFILSNRKCEIHGIELHTDGICNECKPIPRCKHLRTIKLESELATYEMCMECGKRRINGIDGIDSLKEIK